MKRKNNSGQALLVILLIMAVALTIGLSVVSRSVTDIRLSQQQEESARVFSVAEAGIEEAIRAGFTDPTDVSLEGIDITAHVVPSNLGGQVGFVFPKEVKKGDTQTVWLVDHIDENTLGTDFYTGTDLEFYWGNEGTADNESSTPALEAVIIYKEGNEYKTQRAAFDPNIGRVATNDFTLVSKGNYSIGEDDFSFKAIFSEDDDADFPSGVEIYALRLKLLYNDDTAHLLGVKGIDDEISVQGKCYESTARSEETGIARKVQQCQLYPSLPAVFDYVLFSETGLTK